MAGVFNGRTTGAPVMMMIRNLDVDSSSYEEMVNTPRPSHADLTHKTKYGGFNDYRGSGRASARVTAGFVMARSHREEAPQGDAGDRDDRVHPRAGRPARGGLHPR